MKQENLEQKKGQFEIMGVAFLIIILVLGLTVLLLLDEEPKESRVISFERDVQAQAIVDVLLRTDAGPACEASPEASIYDLVRDITFLKYGICDLTPGSSTPAEKKSIEIINEAVKAAVESTTPSRYKFQIYLESDPDDIIFEIDDPETNCPQGDRVIFERTGEQRIRLLPTMEIAVVELRLCPYA